MKSMIGAVIAAALLALFAAPASAAVGSNPGTLRLLSTAKAAPTAVEQVHWRGHRWHRGYRWHHRWHGGYGWRHRWYGDYGYGWHHRWHRRHCWWRHGYRHCRWRY